MSYYETQAEVFAALRQPTNLYLCKTKKVNSSGRSVCRKQFKTENQTNLTMVLGLSAEISK